MYNGDVANGAADVDLSEVLMWQVGNGGADILQGFMDVICATCRDTNYSNFDTNYSNLWGLTSSLLL